MAFQIKDFTSIVAGMINRLRGSASGLTDFTIGSVVRTILEACAVEVDELYAQMFTSILEAIPNATYNSFSFARQAATPASGLVRVTVEANAQDIVIPAGTVFSNPAIPYSYITERDGVIAAGDTYVDVLAVANGSGAATNLVAGQSFACGPLPSGFVSALALGAFLNGRDVETDEQRKARFADYVQNLQRATVAALEYGARTTVLTDSNGVELERVRLVTVVEPYLTTGLPADIARVLMYVHNGVGGTSSALVTRCTAIINGYVDDTGAKVAGWKAAGVPVTIAPATETALTVTAALTVAPGFDGPTTQAAAAAAISGYIVGLGIGAPFVFADAVFAVMSIAGADNIVFSTPTADTPTADANHKFMPGTITVTLP